MPQRGDIARMFVGMHLGLVLPGGGARSAYQVGALRAIARMLRGDSLPFDVVAGISAGAINSVALASGAEDFHATSEALARTWCSLSPERVYRTGALGLARIGTRWILDLSAGGLLGRSGINYLLDPSPLRELLEQTIPVGRMRRHIRSGLLRGVAVSATNYQNAVGVTFFEGDAGIKPWARATRVGVRARLTLDHVMASAAIPVFFPPVRLGRTFYGDGCVRMGYPMSPAVHLGADSDPGHQRPLPAPARRGHARGKPRPARPHARPSPARVDPRLRAADADPVRCDDAPCARDEVAPGRGIQEGRAAATVIAARVPSMTGMPPSTASAAGSPIPRMSSYRHRQANTSGLAGATVPSAYCRPARACLVLRGRGDGIMGISPGSRGRSSADVR